MTNFHIVNTVPSPISVAARAAKAKRRAVLARVEAQRARAYAKKMVSQWIEVRAIIRGAT
jgi:hypothetical protein